MSLWEEIARRPVFPDAGTFRPQLHPTKKNAAPEGGRVLSWGVHASRAYFGAPCTASVTTARVRDGASISRKV